MGKSLILQGERERDQAQGGAGREGAEQAA